MGNDTAPGTAVAVAQPITGGALAPMGVFTIEAFENAQRMCRTSL